MTVIPLSSSVNTAVLGCQAGLSSNDVQSLNKAYSCAGRVKTYGGGNMQVFKDLHKKDWVPLFVILYMLSLIFGFRVVVEH
jgi:hypothetical protein